MGGRGARASLVGTKGTEKVYNRMPKGWSKLEGATTAPRGYEWISNNQSLFSGNRKTALLKMK